MEVKFKLKRSIEKKRVELALFVTTIQQIID